MVLLLARSHYSLLTAPGSPRALCEEAVRLGLDHLALVDAGLYGLWPFAQEAARVGLAALIGAEVVHGCRRLFALARDRQGYRSLCGLLSDRHLRPDFDLARAAARWQQGLWYLCGDLKLLPELAVRVDRDRLRVALPPRGMAAVGGARPRDAGRKLPDPAPLPPRRRLLDAAEVLGLRCAAVREVWFPRPEDYPAHLLLLAVKWNRALRAGEPEAGLAGIGRAAPAMHLPPAGELAAGHEDRPDAVAAAREVVASCELSFGSRCPPVFPAFEVPAGETPASWLRHLAREGLRRRLPDAGDSVQARLRRELQVIEQMGFAPYFLVVRQIAQLAWDRGIPVVGRGSAADSLVAYCLGLTNADPVRYGLLFERFLNPARADLPDIDLDFCWRRRDELLQAVYEHFGHDKVAMIATYNTCGPRAAYAEAAKAAGLPPAEAARRSKLLPYHRRADLDLHACVAEAPGFYDKVLLPAAREQWIVDCAQQLLQAPRHLGVHPGGVVITPDAISQHAPLERAAKGLVVIQYDMHFAEALGLVKIDLLGNRALTIVQDCVAMVRGQGQKVPDLEALPEDDARTAALLRSGRTLGCFQVESPAMRTLLRQMRAETLERVIQAVALVRPGPAAAGMKDAFLRRARGEEEVACAHPLLAEVFADTFGIMLYQEDVIRAAMAVAGMDATAGDRLRRHLGKVRGGEAAEQDAFLVAALRRGLPRQVAERVWAEMARFAGYSFCKAHAVTYGRIAWQCVWLKARWPGAFLAAVLSNDAGYFEKGVYVEDAKRHGVRLLPPCVNEGEERFTLAPDGAIRVGLREVRRLRERTLRAILDARRIGGAFADLDDFLQRVRPERDEAENLALCGALDSLGGTRPELLWRIHVALGGASGRRAPAVAPAGELIAGVLQPRPVRYPSLPEYGQQRRTEIELEVLGYALQAHPVDVLWQARAGDDAVPCGRIEHYAGRRIAVRGWAVALRRHRTENGRPMCFVTIEDGTGIVECTLFPRIYERWGARLQGRGPYRVRGVVEERLGGMALRVLELREDR